VVDQDVVAVRVCIGDTASTDGAACTRHVFDYDLLAERLRHRVGGKPCDRVGRPPCRVWHNHEDVSVRIVGAEYRGDGNRERSYSESELHFFPPHSAVDLNNGTPWRTFADYWLTVQCRSGFI
jgi:hypothetical protein